MKCKFYSQIYHNSENGYCIFLFSTEDTIPPAARKQQIKNSTLFTAIGNYLPKNIEVELYGNWVMNNYGLQYKVESYHEIPHQTLEGIETYLSSIIKGIGSKTAKSITKEFGLNTLSVLESEPEKFLSIKGISERKLKDIVKSYKENVMIRDLILFLAPYKISMNKINQIYEEFGINSLQIIKNQPFSLCKIKGFGFLTVDQIAKNNGGKLNDPLRIESCIFYCIQRGMEEGHLFLKQDVLINSTFQQLNHQLYNNVVCVQEIEQQINTMIYQKKLIKEKNDIYFQTNYKNETETANKIVELLQQKKNKPINELLIAEAEKDLAISLSQTQKNAIKMVFSNHITIITGGPGTGKTTLQKILLYLYEKLGGKKAMLLAPTGRASRRMAESTGKMDACTMHSALGLFADNYQIEAIELDADFIILDEQSMVDMQLATIFFNSIKKNTRIVLIGDVNQLPSVGAGNVFKELIQCSVIPITILDEVFRQKKDNQIAINAKKIQKNDTNLEYGTDFIFLESNSEQEAANIIEKIYLNSIKTEGIENVQILTPYRKKGETSKNELNSKIKEHVNPKKRGKKEIKVQGKSFRIGDRIIQNKNKSNISNGDIGIIKDIFTKDTTEIIKIEFSNSRTVEYSMEEMECIEHSYAITIHKSQGCEYSVVIMPCLPTFYNMLKRNILYTGITRGKKKVYLIGSKESISQAIHTINDEKRNTHLGKRIVNKLTQAEKKQEAYQQMTITL